MAKPIPEKLLAQWRELAESLGPDTNIVRAVMLALLDEIHLERALLRGVRSYAVVDPLGNPAAICLPNAARMFGIEQDIDDLLEGREMRVDPYAIPSGTINARDYGAGVGGPDADDADAIRAATKRAQLDGGATVSLPPGPLDMRGKPFINAEPYAAGDRVTFPDGVTLTVESATPPEPSELPFGPAFSPLAVWKRDAQRWRDANPLTAPALLELARQRILSLLDMLDEVTAETRDLLKARDYREAVDEIAELDKPLDGEHCKH